MAKLGGRSGKVSRTAIIAWSLLSFAGCSAIAGLDGIQEESCAPNCGDAAVIDGKAGDSSLQSDGPSDSSPVDDSSMADTNSPDTGTMSQDSSGGQDSGVIDSGAPVDAPPFDDAPFDSGCGNLNTTSNCSACGDICAAVNTVQTSASCPGSTNGVGVSCEYTCATGYLDCDGPAGTNPPNINGCECHVPGATQAQCCASQGGDCPISHNNGLTAATSPTPAAITFWDCFPACTTTSCMAQVAQDACIAFVGAANAAQCQAYGQADASTPDSYCNGGNNDTAVNGDCICWTFAGQWTGTFLDPKQQGLSSPQNCYYGGSSGTFH